MAEKVTFLAADAGDAVDPGEEPCFLELPDRNGNGRPSTFSDGSDSLVAGETPPAAIGSVEAPQQRPQYAQRAPGKWALVLAGPAIRAVIGVRRGPHPGLGVAVEAMRGRRPKDLVAARTKVKRQKSMHFADSRPPRRRELSVRANLPRWRKLHFRLTVDRVFREARGCHTMSFPALPVARPAS